MREGKAVEGEGVMGEIGVISVIGVIGDVCGYRWWGL